MIVFKLEEVVVTKTENTATRLKYLMNLKGYKQVDILNLCKPYCEQYNVKMNKSDISQYVSGKVEPNQDKLFILGNALNVSEAWLMGYDVPMERISLTFNGVASFNGKARAIDGNVKMPANLIPLEPMDRIPLLGAIACGTPILAQENIEGYVDLPKHIKADFALTCEGDSMIDAGIKDGDVVYIRSQPEVQNGQIAAVLVDGESATLKRFFFNDGVVTLMAANQTYPPIVKSGSDVEQVRVLGLAVGLSRSFFK